MHHRLSNSICLLLSLTCCFTWSLSVCNRSFLSIIFLTEESGLLISSLYVKINVLYADGEGGGEGKYKGCKAVDFKHGTGREGHSPP